MAAGALLYDHNHDTMRTAIRGLQLIREGVQVLTVARAQMIQFCDGATNVAANWDLLASKASFQAGDYADANTAAMNAFTELDTLFSKLTTDGSVSNVATAISQAPAKYGV